MTVEELTLNYPLPSGLEWTANAAWIGAQAIETPKWVYLYFYQHKRTLYKFGDVAAFTTILHCPQENSEKVGVFSSAQEAAKYISDYLTLVGYTHYYEN